ncbi:hypothetical protein [Cupriavidus consociatus]|uniref:hypothetical protein n=1 Tax=Cupriavidus consociatus TaxID=2821357 RepID=UPI001AE72FF6|nr:MULTISPECIES: hypothetical protein [unclassified Cupriavidus]MBP0621064.1 hypothetical protein [Cupriavidus sp. LEh25]MDK2657734.1 hypothetical protein [Cupriavidus sp. LEh21]
MGTATVPNASTQHAAALARILQVTQRAWGLGHASDETFAAATGRGACAQRAPRLSRRARLAQAAARAFEAQVMAIRCRQVFVG